MKTLKTGATVAQAKELILAHYAQNGYSSGYKEEIRRAVEGFCKYCDAEGIAELDEARVKAYMLERYGIEPGVNSKRNNSERRAMHLLLGCCNFNEIQQKPVTVRVIPPQFTVHIDRLLEELRRNRKTEATVNKYHETLYHITKFFDEQGVSAAADLTLTHFTDYIKEKMSQNGKQHAAHQLRTMRLLLGSLYAAGEIAEDFSHKLPYIHNATHQSHLPSSFSSKEIEKLLDSVDRSSPVGKRNYAILLLAAKLGLRSGDIRDLKFEHIDWENNTIKKVQRKTGEPLSLPLLPEIGWALIDYIKHGRPVCGTAEIFVRNAAPHVPLKYYDSMLVRLLQKAGIPTDQVRHSGMHALRHSLATTLLERNTPLPVIQEVLGHCDPNTTQHYISVDVEQLKSCAMEVPNAAKI